MARTVELVLNRESVTLKGKKYFNYYVACEIYGRKSKARIIPKDNGGYALLDILFDNGGDVKLLRKTNKQTNSNGSISMINTYTAVYTDPVSEKVYEVLVKPYKPSDEDWIKMYLESLREDSEDVSDVEGLEVEND